MYLPNRFQAENPSDAVEIIQNNPLATLISMDEGRPFTSHIPLVIEPHEKGLILLGHMARGNPHWKLLDNKPIYVIFHGPNAYISPQWYTKNDVPTWNYAVVHVEGQCSLIEDKDGIVASLRKLSQFAEAKSKDPWSFWIPDDLAADGVIEKSIVAFEIHVSAIKAKFKLSQNRSEEDLQSTVRGLNSLNSDKEKEVAQLMVKAWTHYNRKLK